MEREQRRSRKIRLLMVGALLIALTISYLIILHNMRVSGQPVERMFGAWDYDAAAEVYLEPLSIDAANEGMQVRAYLSPNLSNGKNARAGADRDLTLLITHDQTVEEIKLAAGAHMASSTFEVDLNDGSVIHYPFDSFVARLDVQLMEGKASLKPPARITVWEGVLGYNLHATTSQPGANPNDVRLAIAVSRSGAIILLALCAYGVMLVLGFCAVVMGVLTFINVRPPETGLIALARRLRFRPARAARHPSRLAAAWRRGGHVGVPMGRNGERGGACASGLQMGACRPSHLTRARSLSAGPSPESPAAPSGCAHRAAGTETSRRTGCRRS